MHFKLRFHSPIILNVYICMYIQLQSRTPEQQISPLYMHIHANNLKNEQVNKRNISRNKQ